jgi:hypothetical protein
MPDTILTPESAQQSESDEQCPSPLIPRVESRASPPGWTGETPVAPPALVNIELLLVQRRV